MFTDSHCHLEQLESPERSLAAAADAGVARVVAVSEDEPSMRRVLELKRRFPGRVLAALGFHPMHTVSRPPEEIEQALRFLSEHAPEADEVGEVGLDFKYARTPEEQRFQRDVLTRQLEIAAHQRKPINLHSRRALRQTLEVAVDFARGTGLGAQMHWFTQSSKLVRLCNQAAVYVSVGPSLLFSEEARQVASDIDRELLLLETDSPVPFEGAPAQPAWARRVAEAVAGMWACSLEEVAGVTEANLRRYLGG